MVARLGPEDPLATYRAKRRFEETPEPEGRPAARGGRLYTIQKHAARRLHYDLRLELDGVLKSWAVTRGPSLDPSEKRLAVRTEDHPVDYARFEGRIPEGNYGAGTVLLWDQGEWEPIGDPHEGLEKGKLVFRLRGERLVGRWALVRFRSRESSKRENWLLIKEKDEAVDRGRDVTATETGSVATGREMAAIAAAPDAVWRSAGPGPAKDRPKRRARRSGAPPAFTPPALATLVDELPEGPDWLFEVKFDGYRALAAAAGEDVRIYTRNGNDWTDRYPGVARALAALDLDRVMLDGEIVVVDGEGRSDFGALQHALGNGGRALSFFVFDLLAERGRSLRGRPLAARKERLRELLADVPRSGPVFYTDHVAGDGREMHRTLCARGFEGVIAKRATAPYRPGRGRAWLKIKCGHEQEFVIVGWSPSERGRPFASIVLAQHVDGRLRYAGRSGSGFSDADLAALAARFGELGRDRAPLDDPPPRAAVRGVRWLEPLLVAQIAFSEFTRDGIVRHGRFVGLRQDKPAAAVERERAMPLRRTAGARGEREDRIGGVRLTHPDKVLFPQQGLTKRELALYLEAAAPRMLVHLAGRPVSLVRCPEGRGRQCFFQRHAGAGLPDAIRRFAMTDKRGDPEEYLYIESAEGVLTAAQLGVLEFHVWGARVDDVDRPDRIVFDLDPDPTVGFPAVRDAAARLRDALEALGLSSFPLLTGGKGVHVVVPVRRRHGWPTVKAFARALAERFAADRPDRFVATMRKAKRTGRIFIDHFRNDRTASAIAPYSPRAREGAPVAWPVTWDELARAPGADIVSIAAAVRRLAEPDPWAGYAQVRQGLKDAALRALDVKE